MLGLLPTVRLVSAGLKISPNTRLIRIGLEINIYFRYLLNGQSEVRFWDTFSTLIGFCYIKYSPSKIFKNQH